MGHNRTKTRPKFTSFSSNGVKKPPKRPWSRTQPRRPWPGPQPRRPWPPPPLRPLARPLARPLYDVESVQSHGKRHRGNSRGATLHSAEPSFDLVHWLHRLPLPSFKTRQDKLRQRQRSQGPLGLGIPSSGLFILPNSFLSFRVLATSR